MHNAKAISTTRIAGGLFVLHCGVFRISEKLRNGEQGHALTIKRSDSLRIKPFPNFLNQFLTAGNRKRSWSDMARNAK